MRDLTITGQTPQTFSNSGLTANQLNWALETFDFTATSKSTTVDFTTPTPLVNNEAGLDNVSLVSAAPEPATLALMTLAAIGMAVRRKFRV